MSRPSTYTAWDRALNGRLGQILLDLRSQDGGTYDAIVYELRTTYDIKVSRDTIGRWLEIAQRDATKAAS